MYGPQHGRLPQSPGEQKPRMMNLKLTGLALAMTCLIACSGPAEVDASEQSEAGSTASSNAAGGWSDGDTIPSGMDGVPDIQILKVYKNGSGEVCGSGRRASLKYVAMLANGSVLDPGTRPFTFAVGQGEAIKGWDVVVAKMRIGDSFTILLPQQLAYGPSKGDLRFDMELLSVQ